MSGFMAATNDHLIRSNLWSSRIKEVLEDELMGTRYVDMITDFPDGDTINIPSIGQAEVNDYAEGQAIKYTSMDTGNFTFSIDQYKSSATFITEKMKQDSFYMSRLVSSFVPKQARALAKAMEQKILSVGPDGQTATNANAINGVAHRWIGSGTSESIALTDFAKADYALTMANVPKDGRVAIVHPSVGYTLQTQANIVNLLTPNMQWGRMVSEGALTGTTFIGNVYGFDVYVSQNLKVNASSEQIGGAGATAAAGVNNLFFSAASDVLPFVGLIRQAPKVDSEYNKDYQRDEYVTTCRYGFKLFRPENLVCVVTDTDYI
jgi:hypothetical protein